jgi:hypothetical protein
LLEKLKAKSAIREEAAEIIGIVARLSNAKKLNFADPKLKFYVKTLEMILDQKAVLLNLKRK